MEKFPITVSERQKFTVRCRHFGNNSKQSAKLFAKESIIVIASVTFLSGKILVISKSVMHNEKNVKEEILKLLENHLKKTKGFKAIFLHPVNSTTLNNYLRYGFSHLFPLQNTLIISTLHT